MARIFRIKNKAFRWLAGLIALAIDIIWLGIKAILAYVAIIAITVVAVIGVGVIAHHSLPLIGISEAGIIKEVSNIFMRRFILGFGTVLVGGVVAEIIYILVKTAIFIAKIPAEAKKYGDKYFNSIGDKEKSNESS